MNKIYTILFFAFGFQALAQQQQEYFNFTDSTFKVSAIKRIPYMYHLCGNGIDEYDKKNIDSIVVFLAKHKSIVLELGVYYATRKSDKGEGEYFKSLLIDRGADAARILVVGYGNNHFLYSQKVIKQAHKKHTPQGELDAEKMVSANNRIELKILKQ